MRVNKLLGATLIIIGITIGAGTLALPVALSAFGLYQTLGLLVVAWLVMTLAALIILEVNLWLPEDTNMISMAKATLGPMGEGATWLSYLFLFYLLLSAYILGLGDIFAVIIQSITGFELNIYASAIITMAIIGTLIYISTLCVDIANRFFMTGLILTFFLIFIPVIPHTDFNLLAGSNSKAIYLALPIVLLAFGYHIIIPTLRTYLHGDARKLRLAIILGGLGTLLMNTAWTFLILSVVPYGGETGLVAIQAEEGDAARNLVTALDRNLGINNITTLFNYFALFAITTSMLGVAYSLFDFLADGFRIKKSRIGRFFLVLFVFTPPFIIGIFFANFIGLLQYAAIFVVTLLLLLPAAMAIAGRSKHKEHNRTIGGLITPWFLIITSLVTIGVAVYPFS